jgi:hypothetical protein
MMKSMKSQVIPLLVLVAVLGVVTAKRTDNDEWYECKLGDPATPEPWVNYGGFIRRFDSPTNRWETALLELNRRDWCDAILLRNNSNLLR